jgi:hypothetical protein
MVNRIFRQNPESVGRRLRGICGVFLNIDERHISDTRTNLIPT